MSEVKVPEAQSRLSGLHICFDSFRVSYLGEYFRKIEAYFGSRRAMEHGKCVPRWTGKTDITMATGEPPLFAVLGTTLIKMLYKLGFSK